MNLNKNPYMDNLYAAIPGLRHQENGI